MRQIIEHDRPRRRLKQMGLRRLGERPPDRIPGVEQRAFAEVPSRCPKCGSVFLVVRDRRIACPGSLAGCGWDAFIVTENLALN